MAQNYDILKLGKLIKDYVIYEKEHAGIELSNKTIQGSDLVRVLEDLQKIFNKSSAESNLYSFLMSLHKKIPLQKKKELTSKEAYEIFQELWADIDEYGTDMGVFGGGEDETNEEEYWENHPYNRYNIDPDEINPNKMNPKILDELRNYR